MIGYHKRTLEKAATMLHALRDNPNDVQLLFQLQRLLIQRMKHSEKAIQKLKADAGALKASLRRDRLPKTEAQAKKTLIRRGEQRIKEYRHLIFIWKCFGDGIANVYFDKYALKHTFYSVEDYTPKEDAGFLSGKEGFKKEWSIVKSLIRRGHPVVLCDITNVLRHGDICLVFGDDPFPVEVKSSKNRNERVERQISQLESLHKFYAEDRAENFRGTPLVTRVSFHPAEVNHTADLNDCIERSYEQGMTVVNPERGIHYISIVGKLDHAKMNSIGGKAPLFIALNEVKTQGWWMPYFPFTLSLQPKHLYGFIKGSTYLLVVLDLLVLKELFRKRGFHATVMPDGPWSLQVCKDPKDLKQGVFRVSRQIFERVALEFQSLEWFVNAHTSSIEATIDQYAGEFEIPADWSSVE
ncbi:hypothetical protein LJR296_000568 [Cupriavidus necator]|uniref:hypothetical protein n=1 Tax=Cupriavidus necator TaxID=106590 RepID=UPI003ECC32A0